MGDQTPPAETRAAGFLARLLAKLSWNPARTLREERVTATPEGLANVMVRQFETAFLVIPTVACMAGGKSAELLLNTADVLRSEGGFATRIGFLTHFADVIERQSPESLLAFCDFVVGSEALRATFNAEEKGREAFEALKGIQELFESEGKSGTRQVRKAGQVAEARLQKRSGQVEIISQVHISDLANVSVPIGSPKELVDTPHAEGALPVAPSQQVKLSGEFGEARQVEDGVQTEEPLPAVPTELVELSEQVEESGPADAVGPSDEAQQTEGTALPVEPTGQVELCDEIGEAVQVAESAQKEEPLLAVPTELVELSEQVEESGPADAVGPSDEAKQTEGTAPLVESSGQVELCDEIGEAKQTERDLPVAPTGQTELNTRTADGWRVEEAGEIGETTKAEWAILRDAVRQSAGLLPANQRVRTISDAFIKAPHLSFLRRPLEELARRAAPPVGMPAEQEVREGGAECSLSERPEGGARAHQDGHTLGKESRRPAKNTRGRKNKSKPSAKNKSGRPR